MSTKKKGGVGSPEKKGKNAEPAGRAKSPPPKPQAASPVPRPSVSKEEEARVAQAAAYLSVYPDSSEAKLLATFPLAMFEDEFDAVEQLLQSLPDNLTEAWADEQIERTCDASRYVNTSLSANIVAHYDMFLDGLSHVKQVSTDVEGTVLVVRTARRQLAEAQAALAQGGFQILRSARRRNNLRRCHDLLHKMRAIAHLQDDLRADLDAHEYHDAIVRMQTAKQYVEDLSELELSPHLRALVSDGTRTIKARLHDAFVQMCARFEPLRYGRVLAAYRQFGQLERVLDKIQQYFLECVDTSSQHIVQAFVFAKYAHEDRAEELQHAEFRDLCRALGSGEFFPCLRSVLEALTEVMYGHYQMMLWHSEHLGDADGGEYLRSILQGMRRFTKTLWTEIEAKVAELVEAMAVEQVALDAFVAVMEKLDRFIQIGVSFCGGRHASKTLLAAIKRKSRFYFMFLHQQTLEDLQALLEADQWTYLPLSRSFSLAEVRHFGAFVKAGLLTSEYQSSAPLNPTTAAATGGSSSASDTESLVPSSSGGSIDYVTASDNEDAVAAFEAFRLQGNPFSEAALPDFGTRGMEDPSATENESTSFLEMRFREDGGDAAGINPELYAAYVDDGRGSSASRRSTKPVGKAEVIVTSVCLRILKYIGKYMRMMKALPSLNFEIFTAITQVYEVFLFTVHVYFGAGAGSAERQAALGVPVRLSRIVARVSKDFEASASMSMATAFKEGRFLVGQPVIATPVRRALQSSAGGLQERIVAAESMIFMANAMMNVKHALFDMLPPKKKSFDMFYGETLPASYDVHQLALRALVDRCIDLSLLPAHVAAMKWSSASINPGLSAYCTELVIEFQRFAETLNRLQWLPARVVTALWRAAFDRLNDDLVEAYSRIKACSLEGRTKMKLDYQMLADSLRSLAGILPDSRKVDGFISAYFLQDADLLNWVRDNHKTFSRKQLEGLIVVCPVKPKTKKDIQLFLADLEKANKNLVRL